MHPASVHSKRFRIMFVSESRPTLSLFFFFITLKPTVEWYKSLWALHTSPQRNRFTYEPSTEPLHISAKYLFLNSPTRRWRKASQKRNRSSTISGKTPSRCASAPYTLSHKLSTLHLAKEGHSQKEGHSPWFGKKMDTRKKRDSFPPAPLARGPDVVQEKSHMQTLILYKLSFNQNYFMSTLVVLINIDMCGKFPWTESINYECFDFKKSPCTRFPWWQHSLSWCSAPPLRGPDGIQLQPITIHQGFLVTTPYPALGDPRVAVSTGLRLGFLYSACRSMLRLSSVLSLNRTVLESHAPDVGRRYCGQMVCVVMHWWWMAWVRNALLTNWVRHALVENWVG